MSEKVLNHAGAGAPAPADPGRGAPAAVVAPGGGADMRSRLAEAFSVKKIGGVYVLLLIILYFSITVSDTFPQWDTVRQILNGNAIAALAALALIIPLSAGVFDISVSNTMTLSGIVTAWTVVHTDLPVWVAVILALLASIGVGIVNGIVVVVMKIDSLIGTLATGALITALVTMISDDISITHAKLSGGFADIAQKDYWGLTLPIFYVVIVALVLWHVLEHTATGRRLYATGFNRDATRLAGINTDVLQFATLVVSAFIAGITGVVLASSIGSGSPTAGGPYLLSAFAAVFLGATQLKEGRFNAWGTVIAILLLGTGTTGLALAGAESWARSMFTGIVLIAALAVTGLQRRSAGAGRFRFLRRRRSAAESKATGGVA
jgi:ribose/xylose/arabinose/galactoside ABC-type transport system permease subunit